jgi:hypothetical protein
VPSIHHHEIILDMDVIFKKILKYIYHTATNSVPHTYTKNHIVAEWLWYEKIDLGIKISEVTI